MSPEEVSRQIVELQLLRSELRRWRVGITLTVAVIVVGGVWSIYDAGNSLAREGPEQEELVAEFTKGLNSEVVPLVERVARKTFYETKIGVEKELAKLDQRTPELALALEKEIMALVRNVPHRGEKVLQASFGAMLKKREADIRKSYPDVTEQKVSTLVATLVEVTEEQVEHMIDHLFAPHLEAIYSVLDNMARIQQTETLRPDEELASWDMALLVFDLVRDEFGELYVAEIPPEAPAKLKHKTTKPANSAKPSKP